jgi:hypothetical protein
MVKIKGHVEILRNPELRTRAGSREYLVFQRVGCSDCLGNLCQREGQHNNFNGDERRRQGRCGNDTDL